MVIFYGFFCFQFKKFLEADQEGIHLYFQNIFHL